MSASNTDPLKTWLRQLVGKQIVDVGFSVYVSVGGAPTLEPLQVEIAAEGAKRGMLVLSSDGESIEYSGDDLTIADMGGDGRVERRSVVPGFDPARILSAYVENIELISESAVTRGLEFGFSTGAKLIVVNNGDQMLLSDNRDNSALQEGDIEYERIC